MDTNDSANLHLEDKLYEQVGLEMARKEYLPGPMARAVAYAKGDKTKIEAFYIQFRYEELRRQVELEIADLERSQKRDIEIQEERDRIRNEQDREQEKKRAYERHAAESQAKLRGVAGWISFFLFFASIIAFVGGAYPIGTICLALTVILLLAIIANKLA